MAAPRGPEDLRDKVRFERRADGDDGHGNAEANWATTGVVRSASLLPTRGGEAVQAARLTGTASWDLWVRSDSGTRSITEGDRVVDERDPTRVFNIVFGPADMDGRREWLLLQLTSGQADG